jgi:hypothetical protein
MMELRWVEKRESDFENTENDCNEFHYDECGEFVCEVGENDGGPCYPWECPLCDFVGNIEYGVDGMGNSKTIELVEVIKEVVYE